jgi:hypothetical protein
LFPAKAGFSCWIDPRPGEFVMETEFHGQVLFQTGVWDRELNNKIKKSQATGG